MLRRVVFYDHPGAFPHALHKNVPWVRIGQPVPVLLGKNLSCQYLRPKLIAAAGHGRDQAGFVSHCLAQPGDVLGQVAFLHKGVRPDGLQQLILGHHSSGVQNHVGKNVEGLRRE